MSFLFIPSFLKEGLGELIKYKLIAKEFSFILIMKLFL